MNEKRLELLRTKDGQLVLLAAVHRKFADVIVRDASAIWLRHIPVVEVAEYTLVAYNAPQDVLAQRFLADSLPGVHRDVSPKVLAALAAHGL